MPSSRQRSAYEEGLARAHRALYWAMSRADEMEDQGAVDDLLALQAHLHVMLEDSLKGRKRPKRQLAAFDS